MSRERLEWHLRNRAAMLAAAADRYDDGQDYEARAMAGSLRVLLHSSPTNRRDVALMRQLDLLEDLQMTDSAWAAPGALGGTLTSVRLTAVDARPNPLGLPVSVVGPPQIVTVGKHMPRSIRGSAPATVSEPLVFMDWWSTPVIRASDGKLYSRERVVLVMANQDGGMHVDAELDDEYQALSRDGFGITDGRGLPPEGNVVDATVRQVTWELLDTMQRHLPQYLTAPGPEPER